MPIWVLLVIPESWRVPANVTALMHAKRYCAIQKPLIDVGELRMHTTILVGFYFALATSLLTIASMAGAVDIAIDIDAAQNQIDMPVTSRLKTYDFEENSPWGKVQTHATQGEARYGQIRFIYEFSHSTLIGTSASAPKPTVALAPQKLAQVLRYFLRSHKCSAVEIKQAPLLDADGVAWPQITWAGSCAGGDSYQNTQFIAHNRLYQIGVSQVREHTQAPSNQAAPNQTPPSLTEALRRFALGCRFFKHRAERAIVPTEGRAPY
jgi:hypothetical protein